MGTVKFEPCISHILCYSGDFGDDRISGRGEMQYADGSIYKGQWMDNQVCDVQHSNSPFCLL